MKSKRGYLVILILSVILVIFISGCVQQTESVNSEEAVDEISQVAAGIPEKSKPIEGEANNLTDIIPQQQDVTVNQPAMQETKVQEPKCSREFSPQFNAGPYYSGHLFDAHFHMPPAWEEPETGFTLPVLGKGVTLSQILCYFDKEKVTGAITFNFWEYENLEQSIQDLAEVKKQLPTGIHLFLIPSELLAEELDEIVNL